MAEKSVPSIVDVLIIGAGPAGLSAALSLARQRHTVVVFDSGRYRCDPAREFNIVPTWEHQKPQDYLSAARAEVSRYETVQLEAVEVVTLAKNEEGGIFEAIDIKANKYKGRKVILASGVREIFPDIAGYRECWGKGMYVLGRNIARKVLARLLGRPRLPVSMLTSRLVPCIAASTAYFAMATNRASRPTALQAFSQSKCWPYLALLCIWRTWPRSWFHIESLSTQMAMNRSRRKSWPSRVHTQPGPQILGKLAV